MLKLGQTKPSVPMFVSSTFTEMQDYRRKVQDALTQLETIVRGVEQVGSRPGSLVEECLRVVGSCRVYVGILGMRYGTVPDGHEWSMRHLEYAEAQRLALPSLIYILDENHPIPAKDLETGTGAEKLLGLKEHLKKRHAVSFYTTPEDLQARILRDVPALLKDLGSEVARIPTLCFTADRKCGTSRRRIIWLACIAMACLSAACDKYEPTKQIEGVYLPPTECVTLQGIIPGGWLSIHRTIHPTICQPMRVNELGFYTYGGGWSNPGRRAEVGRLVFSDAGVLVESVDLKAFGTLEYRDRTATPGDFGRNNPIKAILLVLVGLGIAVAIPRRARAKEAARRRERERLEAESAQRAAERAAALVQLRRLLAAANQAAVSLPIILGETELTLNRAEAELQSQLPSPFWEAMEEALARLQAFHQAMATIDSRRSEYSAQAAALAGGSPPFRLDVTILPDPTGTQSRISRLYRQAQAIPHFSLVYEQRRTTSTLVAGFRSLGQAVERLGDRIVTEIGSLANSLGSRLDSLESSLQSSAAAAAEQSAALRAQLHGAIGSNEAVTRQLREDADARSETERLALRMLDNIQNRRKPSIFDRP